MQNIPHHKVAIINQIVYVNRMLTLCKWDFKHFAYPSLFIVIIHIWEILIPMLQNTRNLRFREGKKLPKVTEDCLRTWAQPGWLQSPEVVCSAARRVAPLETGALCRARVLGTWDLQGFLCQQSQICTRPLGFCRVDPISGFPLAPGTDLLSMTGL